MSFWTDIRDTFTAPVRTVTQTVGDILSGQNIADSIGKGIVRGFAAAQGPASLALDIGPIKSALKSDALDGLTLGISGNIADRAEFYKGVNTGSDFSKSEVWSVTRSTLRDGAIVGAAVATGGAVGGAGAFGTATASLVGAKTASGILDGDLGSALSSVTNYVGGYVPDEYKQAFQDAKDFVKGAASAVPAPPPAPAPYSGPQVWGYNSTQSGFDLPGTSSKAAIGVIPLVLVGAALLIAAGGLKK